METYAVFKPPCSIAPSSTVHSYELVYIFEKNMCHLYSCPYFVIIVDVQSMQDTEMQAEIHKSRTNESDPSTPALVPIHWHKLLKQHAKGSQIEFRRLWCLLSL